MPSSNDDICSDEVGWWALRRVSIHQHRGMLSDIRWNARKFRRTNLSDISSSPKNFSKNSNTDSIPSGRPVNPSSPKRIQFG